VRRSSVGSSVGQPGRAELVTHAVFRAWRQSHGPCQWRKTRAVTRDPGGNVVASTAELIPTFTDDRLGYQVLDARSGIGAARLDDQIRADLAASLARVRPHVGRWIPPV